MGEGTLRLLDAGSQSQLVVLIKSQSILNSAQYSYFFINLNGRDSLHLIVVNNSLLLFENVLHYTNILYAKAASAATQSATQD